MKLNNEVSPNANIIKVVPRGCHEYFLESNLRLLN